MPWEKPEITNFIMNTPNSKYDPKAHYNLMRDTCLEILEAKRPETTRQIVGLLENGGSQKIDVGAGREEFVTWLQCRHAPSDWLSVIAVREAEATPIEVIEAYQSAPYQGAESSVLVQQDCIIAYGLTRDGLGFAAMEIDKSIESETAKDSEPIGTIPDYMRCFMGLPTPAPVFGTEGLMYFVWLFQIIQKLHTNNIVTYADAVMLLSYMLSKNGNQLWDADMAEGVETDDVIRELKRQGGETQWEEFRLQLEKSNLDNKRNIYAEAGITPQTAKWMDEGVFARCMLEFSGEASNTLLSTLSFTQLADGLYELLKDTAIAVYD